MIFTIMLSSNLFPAKIDCPQRAAKFVHKILSDVSKPFIGVFVRYKTEEFVWGLQWFLRGEKMARLLRLIHNGTIEIPENLLQKHSEQSMEKRDWYVRILPGHIAVFIGR